MVTKTPRQFSARSLRYGVGLTATFTLCSKAVGYVRQLLVAYYFGISRHVDIFLMAQGITMLLVFSFTTLFDRMAVPHLVRRREEDGEEAFRILASSIFTASLAMGFAMTVVFVIFLWPTTHFMSHGFQLQEQNEVRHTAYFFIPWILTIFPYSALTAILKSLRYFDVVLSGDLAVTVIATAGFIAWHGLLIALPLMMALGYAVSLIGLIFFTKHVMPLIGSWWNPLIQPVYRNFAELSVANLSGLAHTAIDRFFQSYLRAGSISAYGYATLTLAPVHEFFSFDEVFMVPLASSESRIDKLHRLLSGILLVTIPVATFLIMRSEAIIRVLYEHGHFSDDARRLTALVFRIAALGVVSSAIETPLVRTLQITDHVLKSGLINVFSTVLVTCLNWYFIFHLKLDVLGVVISMVASSYFFVFASIFLLARTGIYLQLLRLSRYALWAVLASALSGLALRWSPVFYRHWEQLGVDGVIFGVVLALCYLPVRRQITFILYGARHPKPVIA